MKPKCILSPVFSAFLSVAFSSSSHAQTNLFWDSNGSTGGTGGSGSWNTTSTTTWRSGSETGTFQAFSSTATAVLGGTAGTLTLSSAVTAAGISVLSTTTGATYSVVTSSTNTLTLGAAAPISVASGKTLAFSGAASGAVISGSATTTIQGGGLMTVAGTNRVFAGVFDVTGTGTTLRLPGTNALDNGSSAGLAVRNGGVVEVNGANNFRRGVTMGGSTSTGGTLRLGNNGSLVAQSGFAVNVLGTGKSSIVSSLTNTGTALANYGGISGNGGTNGTFSVASTGDASGVDLEYSAGFRNGRLRKTGAGVMRLNAGYPVNFLNDYDNSVATSFGNASTSLLVDQGTFINEGNVMSMATVTGGILRTGGTTGTFDVVNVNGGIFEPRHNSNLFRSGLTYAAGQKAINFGGGTLRYGAGFSADLSSFFSAIPIAGGSVDTNENNVTFSSSLSGAGTLTKKGAGSLTLAGTHSLAGLNVDAGTLKLAADASLGGMTVALTGTGQLDATTGATFNGAVLASALAPAGRSVQDVVGNLTLASGSILRPGGVGGETQMNFDGNLTVGGSYEVDVTEFGLDKIVVTGNLNLSNAQIAVRLATSAPTAGVIASYGGELTGMPQLTGYILNSRYAPSIVHNAGAKTIELTLSNTAAPLALAWNGDEGSAWDLTTGQKNFTQATTSAPDKFQQFDLVTFGDTQGSKNVVLTGELAPGSLTFNHSVDYTLSGSGSIAGVTSLVKEGTGTLNLFNDNTYSGVTTINQGQVNLGNGGTTGSLGTGAVTNHGILAFNHSSNIAISQVIGGAGSVVFQGSGTYTIGTGQLWTGGTTILSGTVKRGVAGAIPTPTGGGASVVVAQTGTLDLGGFAYAGSSSLPIVVSGSGSGLTTGTVINSGNGLFSSGINFLSLAGDAALGGNGSRFDLIGTSGAGGISSTDPLTPRKFTKVGSNQISLKTDNYAGVSEFVVNGGTLGVENDNIGSVDRKITVNASGTLSLWGSRNLSNTFVLNGGTLSSDNTANTLTGSIQLSANSIISGSAGLTVSGVVSGAATLIKDGASDLTMSNSNTYTGGTALRGTGRLIVTDAQSLGADGSIEIAGASGSQVTLASPGVVLSRPITFKSGGRVNEGSIYNNQANNSTIVAGDVTVAGAVNAGGVFGSISSGELVISGRVIQSVIGLDPLQPASANPVRVSIRNGTVRFENTANDFRWLYLSENTIKLGANNALPTSAVVSLGDNTNAAILEMNGFNQEVRSLCRWASTGSTTIRNTATSPSVLTFHTDFNGCAQVETALAAGTALADGDVIVTVTGQYITGSPLAVSVPVANGDTPAVWADKVRAALANETAIANLYTVSSNGNQIILTAKTNVANDATFNIALANGTASPGITVATTSNNASPGVLPFYAGNVTGNLSVVKKGPETLTLSGTHTHTGTTTVQQGKLLMNANHTGSSTLTVEAGAALGGTGSTDAPVIVRGIITGGDTNTLGTINTGALTLNSGSTLAVNINTTDLSADYIKSSGSVTLDSNVNLTISDVNPAAVAAGATLQIVGHSGTFNGTLVYNGSVVPDGGLISVGSNNFRVKYNDSTPSTPALTLTAVEIQNNSYLTWAAANGITGAAFNDDSDSDGLSNGLEYAIAGLNPNSPDQPSAFLSNGTVTFIKRPEAVANGDLTYTIETSSTLAPGSWTTVTPSVNDATTISYVLPTGQGSIFARLRVNRNTP